MRTETRVAHPWVSVLTGPDPPYELAGNAMRFDVKPYGGALPIAFGLSREQVHQLLGAPQSSCPIWDGSGTTDHYDQARIIVGYNQAGLVNHVGFSPGRFELTILEQLIWTPTAQPDPNPFLLAHDPEPLEFVGFWIFAKLGVTTTGYHDDDPSQRALTVFPHGAHSESLAQGTPADTSRYRLRPD